MSIPKIFGTETEFRLDVNSEHKFELENQGANTLLINLAMISGSIPAINRDTYRCSSIEDLKKSLGSKTNQSTVDAVREHLNHRQPKEERDLFSEYAKRLGAAGGYLVSGHRIYLDGAHPEMCTPECSSPLDLVRWEKAGVIVMELGCQKLEHILDSRAALYKNVTDYFGNSWGAHENYLVTNHLFENLVSDCYPPSSIQNIWATFLATRYVYCGSGQMGYEFDLKNESKNIFLVSQRSEFMCSTVSHNTMSNRAFINSRDISYTSNDFGRRLHVICGDANMCDMAIYLKIGMAAVVLMMLEDAQWLIKKMPFVSSPVLCSRFFNPCSKLKSRIKTTIGQDTKSMNAIEIQKAFLELAIDWHEHICANSHPMSRHRWMPQLFEDLGRVLNALEEDRFNDLFGKIDWVTKLMLIEKRIEKLGYNLSTFEHSRSVKVGETDMLLGEYVRALDMAYHRIGESGLYNQLVAKGKIKPMFKQEVLQLALNQTPEDTRAYDRQKTANELGSEIAIMNWHKIITKTTSLTFDDPWRKRDVA